MQHRFTSSSSFRIVLGFFILLTGLEVINLLTGRMLNQFALLPREAHGLIGIIVSPFIHGSFWHYLSNIVPLCLFSFLLLQYGHGRFWIVTLFIISLTGILVWLFGRSAFHLGASGLVYGYFGFLVLAGFLSKQPKLIGISLLVAFFYGGLIFGVLPLQSFISWESHLFGLISGLLAARLWAKHNKNEIP